MKIFDVYNQDQSGLEQRVAEIQRPLISGDESSKILRNCLGVLDLTTLEGSDTIDKVSRLCQDSRFSLMNKVFPDAAAVCVYPSLVNVAVKELQGTGIRVASVAGAFPSGQTSLGVKLEEVRFALGEGAEEIDTVISRGKLIEGRDQEVFDELAAIREVCGSAHLKIILETGELLTIGLILKASEIAILSGADFIKTSTGKIATGATPVAFMVMLDTISEYLEKTGKAIGIKPAGGIRTTGQAILYYRLLSETLGEQWCSKDYFRIGASSLAGEIFKQDSIRSDGTKFDEF